MTAPQLCLNCHMSPMEVPANEHPAYVFCPTCGAIELTYQPLPHQDIFHATPALPNTDPGTQETWPTLLQIIGVFGGYGSAKSRASLEEMLLRCLENPGGTGLFCAPTLQQLRRTTLKTWFNEVCPPQLIENFNKADMEIKMINGFTWYVIPTDDEEKLRSINAGLVHMEEASGIKRSIFDQINTRMRDPFTKNRAIIVCSNPDLGWIKEVLVDNDKRAKPTHPEHEDYNPQITNYVWPTKLNRYLPPDFIDNLRRGRPEWWQKRFLDGSFEHSEGMVYPNIVSTFTTSQEYFAAHDITQIPAHWDKFATMDHGMRNPTAIYLHAINPNNWEVVTYKEYYVAGRTVPQHVEHVKPMLQSVPLGKMLFQVADPSTRNKTDPVNGKSVQGLYEEYGIFWQEGNNNVEAGILRVNSYIERGKWKILTDECPHAAKEAIGYKFKEITMDDGKNPDEKPVKYNDHAMDSIRYGFMRLPDDPDLLKTIAYAPPSRYNKSVIHDEEEDDYTEQDFLSYV